MTYYSNVALQSNLKRSTLIFPPLHDIIDIINIDHEKVSSCFNFGKTIIFSGGKQSSNDNEDLANKEKKTTNKT